jgi:hypothetical protein
MLEQIYRELVELQAFANFNRFTKFNRALAEEPIYLGVDVHKKAVERVLDQLIANAEFAVENLSLVRDNLGDIENRKKRAVLLMMYLIAGLPNRLRAVRDRWSAQPLNASQPCALSEDDAFALQYAIEAAAHNLGELGRSQSRDTKLYERMMEVRGAIWAGDI